MNLSQKEKGIELERAVRLIEITIFKYNPELQNCKYEIESNKIIHRNGVRYEIDLLVKIFKGNGYDSTFLFECKNHNRKTKWEEVLKLNEKVKAINAQKGYLIANGFTKSTINFLKKENLDERIELIESINFLGQGIEFPKPTILIDDLFYIKNLTITISNVENNGKEILIQNPSKLNCIFCNENVNLIKEIINPSINYLKDKRKKALQFEKHTEIEKEVIFEDILNYEELFIDGEEVMEIKYYFVCTYIKKLIYPKVISKIDIKNRGRFLSIELDLPEREKMIMEIAGIN